MSGNVALRAALHEAKEAGDISLAEFLAELRKLRGRATSIGADLGADARFAV